MPRLSATPTQRRHPRRSFLSILGRQHTVGGGNGDQLNDRSTTLMSSLRLRRRDVSGADRDTSDGINYNADDNSIQSSRTERSKIVTIFRIFIILAIVLVHNPLEIIRTLISSVTTSMGASHSNNNSNKDEMIYESNK